MRKPEKTRIQAAIAALSLALSAGHPARAETGTGAFAFRGIGGQTCATLFEDPDPAMQARQVETLALWLSGYLTHANRSTAGVFDLIAIQDETALAAVVTNICRSNPDKPVGTAADALIQALGDWTVHEASPQLVINEDGNVLRLREATLAKLQAHLAERGLMAAPVPPVTLDDATRQALKQVQGEHGLAPTGLPDAQTLLTIFLRPATP